MKRTYFIKHDQRIRRVIGCDRATLIFDRLEFYSSRQPDGFYKFIEPNSHRLYKKDDSWTELLECHRTSFWRAFKFIGKKHTSRWTFEESTDKFEGKLYASYYDRNTNRMFFVRNHDAVKELFASIDPKMELEGKLTTSKDNSQSIGVSVKLKNAVRTEQNAQSYKESKPSSLDLSKDKSHAEEIIKKMIEIWTALVQEGRGQIVELEGKIIPFLKKALKDKFYNCLQKWKDYCTNIARSKFLMGEKTSWRADLEWALKFESIRKVLSGNYYGIGDRTPKAVVQSLTDLQQEILSSEEDQETKDFRILCLNAVGAGIYASWFKNLTVDFRENGDITLIAAHKFGADSLEREFYSYLRVILQGWGRNYERILILAPGETKGRLVERERGGESIPVSCLASPVEPPLLEELPIEEPVPDDEPLQQVSSKTQSLRDKLKKALPSNQFPSWLGNIEVEDIGQDGTVVVTLEDSLTVGWCRSRYTQEVFQAASSLWKGVNRLVIRQKSENNIPILVENPPKISEHVEEKSTLEQAIQSFLSVCSPKFTGIQGAQGGCLSPV